MADAYKLVGPTLLTNSAATIYTVPADTTFVMKSVRIANTSGTAATAFLSIGNDAAGTRIVAGESVPANGSITLDLWLPIPATTVLQAYSGTNNVLTITIGGVEST